MFHSPRFEPCVVYHLGYYNFLVRAVLLYGSKYFETNEVLRDWHLIYAENVTGGDFFFLFSFCSGVSVPLVFSGVYKG